MKLIKFHPLLLGILLSASISATAQQLDTLIKAGLEGTADTEVIMSRVEIPPNTTLPKHWHPGEEFVYVLDGSVTLWQEGKADAIYRQGDAAKVSLRQIHTARTGKEGVTLIVFRVHQQGQPERILVETDSGQP